MRKAPESSDRATGTATGTPERSAAPPRDLPERFALLRPVGGGGQGEVWLAEDRVLGQRVALKIIRSHDHPSARRRIVLEARVGREQSHPNLIRVFELVELPERLVVVMEWVPGGSVKDRLARGPMPVAEVAAIARQVLDVLAHLHARGIVHRDIKPSNLLLDGDGQVKLADLGLVRQVDRPEGLTRTGFTVGSPDYMSPEQLRGSSPAPAADLYGLGVSLFELLTGRRPFGGSSEFEVANQHLNAAPPDVRALRPDCPRWLAAFVRRLLEKDQRDRWPDAAAARTAFLKRRAPLWRLWRWRAALALVAVMAAAVLWTAVARQRPRLADVVLDGAEIVALDSSGGELWRRRLGTRLPPPLVADVVGSAAPEVVVGLNLGEATTRDRRAEVAILSADGQPLERIQIDTSELRRFYPHLSDEISIGQLAAADLDGDGRPELLWYVCHPDWYPAQLDTWWGRRGRAQHTLAVNSGRFLDLTTADVDGDGGLEVVTTAFNNPLGFQNVLAVYEPTGLSTSPDLLKNDLEPAVVLYAPLGPSLALPRVAGAGPDGFTLRFGTQTVRLTAAGSSADSTARVNWLQRRLFWDDLTTLCRQGAMHPDEAVAAHVGFVGDHAGVLAEPGSRLASTLLLARSLALGHDHAAAITVLEAGVRRDPDLRDLWLRLGEQLLISGIRDRGRSAVLRSLSSGWAGRNAYDAPLMLCLDAALAGDEAAWEEAVRAWDAYAPDSRRYRPHELSPLWPFFRGSWADPGLDPEVESTLYREANVMRQWARLESGTSPAEIAEVAASLAHDEKVTEPARLLEALALSRAGRASEALPLARDALETLTAASQTSLEAFTWVPVAEWVLGRVLAAADQPDAARAHLARAAELAPHSWMGRTTS